MAKDWLVGKWLTEAKRRWAEWDSTKEDTSPFWNEKIPNISELEKMTNIEVISVVAGVLYPGMSLDYRENNQISELHKVITYFRTMKLNLGTCSIGPRIDGIDVPGYENKIKFKWDDIFRYEEWDWDDSNEAVTSKYSNALNRQTDANGPITRRGNFYGASFDEYPFYIAAKKNVDRAVLASFVIDDYKNEDIIIRAKTFVDGLDEKQKKEEMYRYVIDEIAESPYLSSLSEDHMVEFMLYVSKNRYKIDRFMDHLNSRDIWELYKTPEVFREVVQLAHIKKIMGS